MEHRYRQLMRKVRLYLLTEVRKKSWASKFLSASVFDSVYWSWNRQSVATGAGWGAAAAIAPLPMQSLWGVFACLWRKGNIPVAILMAWLSPSRLHLFCHSGPVVAGVVPFFQRGDSHLRGKLADAENGGAAVVLGSV